MLQSMSSQRIGHDLETEQQLRPQVNYSQNNNNIKSKGIKVVFYTLVPKVLICFKNIPTKYTLLKAICISL